MAWYAESGRTTAVKEYGSHGAMDKDVRNAAEHGWEVVSTVPKVRRQAWKLLGAVILWLLWPTTGYVVTYRRAASA